MNQKSYLSEHTQQESLIEPLHQLTVIKKCQKDSMKKFGKTKKPRMSKDTLSTTTPSRLFVSKPTMVVFSLEALMEDGFGLIKLSEFGFLNALMNGLNGVFSVINLLQQSKKSP